MTNLYELSESARYIWKRWIKDRLAAASSSQQKVAVVIFGTRDDKVTPKNTTEVNRFVDGEPAILRRWFEDYPTRLDDLATEMDVTAEELRSKLQSLAAGLAVATDWHPAFPAVGLSDAMIPSPLTGSSGSTPTAVARDFVKQLPDPSGWRSETTFPPLELVAPPGASRTIALQQLRDAIEEALETRLIEQPPAQGDSAKPPLRPKVCVASGAGAPRPLEICVVGVSPDGGASHRNAVRLGRWGAAQAVQLADRLANCSSLPDGARRVLRLFAHQLEAHPGWTPPAIAPDVVIRWLADVSKGPAPATGAEARQLLTAATWRRCQAANPDGALGSLSEALPDALFALIATRERDLDEVGPWTRVARAEALKLLAQAMNTTVDGPTRADLLRLVDELPTRRASHGKPIDALRAAILGAAPDALLRELIRGGVLREGPGGTVQATDVELAATHAARQLQSAEIFAARPDLLVDPDAAPLIHELARHGVPWADFSAATDRAPEGLAADACLARLRFIWSTDHPVPNDALVSAWSGVVWAAAHGLFASTPEASFDRWNSEARALLTQVSWRFRHDLPLFSMDPVADLRALTPAPVQRLVARWRSTPTRPGPQSYHFAYSTGWEVTPLRGRHDLLDNIRSLAPAQRHPSREPRVVWFRGWPVTAASRLDELAGVGDPEAIDTLTGRAVLRDEPGFPWQSRTRENGDRNTPWQVWRALPVVLRIRWARLAGPRGQDGYKVLRAMLAELKHKEEQHLPDLVELGVLIGRERLEDDVASDLSPGRPRAFRSMPDDLAWALAERLALTGPLLELANWPAFVAPRLRLGFDHTGPALTWGAPFPVVPLKIAWTEGPGGSGDSSSIVGRHVAIDLVPVLEVWADDAVRAATVLARLGQPEALVAIWRGEGVAPIPQTLLQDIAAIERLLVAFEAPEYWLRDGAPMEELRALGESATPVDDVQHTLSLTRRHQSGARRTAESLAMHPWLVDDVRSALAGLLSLYGVHPSTWPPRVKEWLGRCAHQNRHDEERLRLRQVEAAATHLLELGYEQPLEQWVRGLHLEQAYDRTLAHFQRNADAVHRWCVADRTRLDRLWSRLKAAGPVSSEAHDQLEWWLLREGSSSATAWKPVPRPGCPRSFVLETALRDHSDPHGLDAFNKASPRWAPVLRARYAAATDRGVAATWTLELSKLEPKAEEIERELRYWMLDDPDPCSGPTDRHQFEDGSVHCGTMALLQAALELNADWLEEGLVRLWHHGMSQPWSCDDEDRPPSAGLRWWERCRLGPEPSVPGILASALIARNHASLVVDAWPAISEDPDRENDQRRRWFATFAPPHAPDALLRARVRHWLDDPARRPVPWLELDELLRRGRGLDEQREAALVLANNPRAPNLVLLARTSPSTLWGLVESRVRSSPDPRPLLGRVMVDASCPGLEATGLLARTRNLLAEMDPVASEDE
jgi:hypothetical protein